MSLVTTAFGWDDAEHGKGIALKGGCRGLRSNDAPGNNFERANKSSPLDKFYW